MLIRKLAGGCNVRREKRMAADGEKNYRAEIWTERLSDTHSSVPVIAEKRLSHQSAV